MHMFQKLNQCTTTENQRGLELSGGKEGGVDFSTEMILGFLLFTLNSLC